MGGRRAMTTATVVAMLVIVLVALMAAAKILQLYAGLTASLASVSAAEMRPQLTIMSVSPTNSSALQVVVANKGDEPVRVLGAYAFEYGANGTPTSAVNCTNITPTYVPVGGNFTCYLPPSFAEQLSLSGRPLRMEVLTDRGPALLGFASLRGNLVVVVQQPQWMVGVPPGATFLVRIWCPLSAAEQGAQPVASFSVPSVANFTGPTTRAVYVPNLTAGLCLVELYYDGPYRLVLNPFNPGNPSLAEAEEAGAIIDLQQVVAVNPGGTTVVSFKMPEVYTSTKWPPPPAGGAPVVYDFSWYYYPALNTTFWNLAWYARGFEGSSAYAPGPLAIAESLLQHGIVYASSPQACPVENLTAFEAFVLGPKTFWINFALDNGIPFTAGPCVPSPSEPMLELAVPFYLPPGKYIVIPIFSAYVAKWPSMERSPYKANISTSLSGPGAITAVNPADITGVSKIQAAAIYIVDAPSGGNFTLYVGLSTRNNGSELVGAIQLSKIVAIPILREPAYCVLWAPPDTFPFATVNLTSGTVERNASVVLNYAISTSYFDSASQGQSYLYLDTKTGLSGYFYATQGNVQINGNSILGENATPYYIQNASYAVEIGADVVGNGYAAGGLYAYYGPYTPYTPENASGDFPLYPSVLPLWYEQEVSSSGSWVFLYSAANASGYSLPGSPAAEMVVNVSGEPGDYVVLSLFAAAAYGMETPPSISVSGGALVSGPSGGQGLVTLYAPVVVQMTSPTATITIAPPMNQNGQGLVGLINVEVVRPPQLSSYEVAGVELGGAPLGILLENVTSPTGSVTAELIDAEYGELVSSWAATVPQNQPTNVLLGAGNLGYGPVGWDAGLQFLDQQVPFLLVIYGAYCGG